MLTSQAPRHEACGCCVVDDGGASGSTLPVHLQNADVCTIPWHDGELAARSRMTKHLEGALIVSPDTHIAVVVSRFNDFLTDHMLQSAMNAYHRLGGNKEDLTVAHVPGSLELPVTALKLGQRGQYDAIVCLGCVIRGTTDHYEHVCEQTAKGIREAGLETGVPTIFGVVTADTVEQAVNRCGVKMGNQGEKAMMAAIEMVNLMKEIGSEGDGGQSETKRRSDETTERRRG